MAGQTTGARLGIPCTPVAPPKTGLRVLSGSLIKLGEEGQRGSKEVLSWATEYRGSTT